ncbi:MAG: hypothetical protein HeimC2_26070 [Candidatus Heimdallarchaeota archaeon LC_2]|nr:MAG: hypothetical protein HeimC2_26070 [Candidatus Heimdallarchaeota archaeon LC_2]
MATSRRSSALTFQRPKDFFKSATRNITFMLWVVRLIAIAFLFVLMSETWGILDSKVRNFDNFQILFKVIILFFFVIFLAILTVAVLITIPISTSLQVSGLSNQYFNAARAFILTNMFGEVEMIDGFDKDQFFGIGDDPLTPLAYLINKPQRNLYNSESLYGFIILLFILMLITGIGFIRRSSVSLAGATLVISQIVIGLAIMKDLSVELELDPSSIGTLLDSPLFRLALISYAYFEYSLQTGYLYSLAAPARSRQQRVSKQLSKLSEFRLGITKLGTDEEKASDRAAKRRTEGDSEEKEEKTSTAISTSSDSTSARKFGADALLFLLDSAQDSLFAKPGGEQERLTGRLQRYHDGLLAHDRKIDEKLGGSAGKGFNPFILVTIFVSMIFRIALIVLLSWMALNPDLMLEYIALPESLTNSIEIHEPEGMLLVLIPMVFFIIGFSYFITRLQSWIIKAEELIIQESEIQKLLKAGKAIRSRSEAEKISAAREAQGLEGAGIAGSAVSSDSAPIKRKRKRKFKKK